MAKKLEPKIIFDSLTAPKARTGLLRFFGFTRSGSSILGELMRKLHTRREVRKAIGQSLVVAGFLVLSYYTTRNIGGNPGINLVVNPPVVDASTLPSTQVPLKYDYESRGYSWFHSGADLAAPIGTAVSPVMTGTVEQAGPSGLGYGNWVLIAHDQGYESLYGHLSLVEVNPGQRVSLNTEIGKVGSTGFSTGPHLHLEIHYKGQTIDPSEIVPQIK